MPGTYAIQDAYLYGPDLLVAPVWQTGQVRMDAPIFRRVRTGSMLVVRDLCGRARGNGPAPFGQPPVFYRAGSEFAELFAGLRHL